jgi:hypothetical protein
VVFLVIPVVKKPLSRREPELPDALRGVGPLSVVAFGPRADYGSP